jgi:hypothetical protein
MGLRPHDIIISFRVFYLEKRRSHLNFVSEDSKSNLKKKIVDGSGALLGMNDEKYQEIKNIILRSL